MSLSMTSTDFGAGQAIPQECTGEGADRSPQLRWDVPPAATRELVLICEDPDAPTPQPWVHWVLYALSPTTTSLPPDLPPDAELDTPVQARQGKNSWSDARSIGYRGPMPPPGHGVHHYHFRLYALDTKLPAESGLTCDQLRAAMEGHVVATGELVGTYQRL